LKGVDIFSFPYLFFLFLTLGKLLFNLADSIQYENNQTNITNSSRINRAAYPFASDPTLYRFWRHLPKFAQNWQL